jgi:hypothetical protein
VRNLQEGTVPNRRKKQTNSGWQKVDGSLVRGTHSIKRATALVSALAVFATQTLVLAGVIIGGQQSPAGLPKMCPDEIASVSEMSPVAGTDEVFWRRHPELKRRKIRPSEKALSNEWWEIHDSVSTCRNSLRGK